ncbi:MAG: PEGA domain-containing protein [Spirochaetales bacterium]|nr:PEGA domain-containing protein [Spirochaetales bacterium]
MWTQVKILGLFFFLTTIPFYGFAETSDDNANLFISSSPLNAVILIDGEPLLQRTPALASNLSAGLHQISIRKEGFDPFDSEITLIPGGTKVFSAELSQGSMIISLPGAESVYLKTDGESLLPPAFRLPEGEFNFRAGNNKYYIEPVYPNEGLFTINSSFLLVSTILTIAATIIEAAEYGEINLPHSRLLSVAEVATVVLGITEIALLYDKTNYIENYRVYGVDLSKLESEAESLYQKAQRSLSVGNLEESLAEFSRLVSEFPDSARFPESLYKIAKIHIISGDTNLAVSELNIIIENFPAAGIYDKACQTLALLYYNNGQLDESRKSVEKMVYFDPLFSDTRESIEAFGIEDVIENWARNPERQAD